MVYGSCFIDFLFKFPERDIYAEFVAIFLDCISKVLIERWGGGEKETFQSFLKKLSH